MAAALARGTTLLMARLTANEFEALIRVLTEAHGLGKLQDRLVRLNAVVSRRRLGSETALARQLYPLTGGLERDGVATRVVLALWEELLGQKLEEDSSKRLDELAERVNACLTERHEVEPAKENELREALEAYRQELAGHVGEDAARLTMLCRAVPGVARLLRSS